MLAIDHLSVSYGESAILKDINIRLAPGKVVCLMGRNGVGKTTLMKCIMGLLKPQYGKVYYNQANITQWPTSQRARAGIGYVPQGRGIFPHLTVYENLLMGFEAAPGKKIDEMALDEIYTIFPILKKMHSRSAGALSGGQQQQLALGRVLVRRPRLLLLDEPTEGVQPSIMHEIEALIVALHKQGEISILLVEQFLDFAVRVGSYFYIMETGTIVMEGLMAEFDQNAAREYLAF